MQLKKVAKNTQKIKLSFYIYKLTLWIATFFNNKILIQPYTYPFFEQFIKQPSLQKFWFLEYYCNIAIALTP